MIPVRRKPRRLNIYVGLESDPGTEWGRVGPDEHGPARATGGGSLPKRASTEASV